MSSEYGFDLDSLIEEALNEEPARPVPPGLRARLQYRIRVAALSREEKRRFRVRLGATAACIAVALGVAGMAAFALDTGPWLQWNVPGGWGYLDFVAVSAVGPETDAMGLLWVFAALSGCVLSAALLSRPLRAIAS